MNNYTPTSYQLDYYSNTATTTGYANATAHWVSSGTTPTTQLPDPPKRKRRMWGANVKEAFDKLAKGGPPKSVKRPSAADMKRLDLRPIAGAAPEAETSMKIEHKKKVKLERTVGVDRPDKKEAHRGTVEMVRTMEGPQHLTENIGISVTGNGGGHVEIPVTDLRKALDELDPPPPEGQDPAKVSDA